MNNFTLWTHEEEQFMRENCEQNQKICWERFSVNMSEALNLSRKSPSQCLEKFQQLVLSDATSKIDWSVVEQQTLIQKHREMGNKWASISQFLNGKNDNCVKNHFYSKLRKMIRKLNRIIQFYFKKTFKAIPNATIYKLVEASQERFKEKPNCGSEVSMVSQDVISKMLRISLKQDLNSQVETNFQKQNLDQFQELIQQISIANKVYKKKSKKIKNSTIKAPIRTSKGTKGKKVQNRSQSSEMKEQSEQQEVQKIKIEQKFNSCQTQGALQPTSSQPRNLQGNQSKSVQIKQGDEMQQLLKNIGLLHEVPKTLQAKQVQSEFVEHSLRSYSDVQNPSEDLEFFDDSYDCSRKQSRMFSRINKRLFGDNSSQIEGL